MGAAPFQYRTSQADRLGRVLSPAQRPSPNLFREEHLRRMVPAEAAQLPTPLIERRRRQVSR